MKAGVAAVLAQRRSCRLLLALLSVVLEGRGSGLQGLGQTRLLMPNLITAGPVTVLCVLKILGSLAGSLLELAPRVYAICRSELG